MRNLKRFLAMALTMLMVAGCFSVLSFAFTDDDKIVNYKEEINVLTAMGVIKGQEDGSYNPEGSFTRRQAAIIFARILVGETSAEYENANFKGDKNVTPFTDLDATGDYYGAISIANLQGIVRGNGDNTFNPNGTLMFQEILTMAVRALGYDSETMNNGYPVSYIIKAKELGLLKGIANVPASTAVATRGVVAKVVYNMLFDAKTADNKTLVEVKFPGAYVKNVVLTAVKGYNLTGVKLPSNTTGGGYVALNALNADGSLDTEVTYFFPWAELDTAGDAKEYVGTSYRIITLDNFKTLVAAQMNGRDVIKGTLNAVNDKGLMTLNSKSYYLVKKYSTIFNTGATWTGNNEIIMLDITSADQATIENLVGADIGVLIDNNANILEVGTHQIRYYYMPVFSVLHDTVYGVKATDGIIVPVPMDVIAEDEDVAISYNPEKATHPYLTYVKDNANAKYNRYVKVIAYDDNNDGLYDRGVWARYNYGRYIVDGSNAIVTVGAHNGKGSAESVTVAKANVVLDDASIKLANGDYVTWYFNPISKLVHIGKEFTVMGGYLKAFDLSKYQMTIISAEEYNENWFTITAAGTKYTAVDSKLYGAHDAALIVPNGDWTMLEDLLGQYVNFIYDDVSGRVITIFDNTDGYYMFDTIVSYQFDGYANIRVFNFKTLKYEFVKAHTINGYPYYSFQGFGNAGAANEIEGVLEYGDIFTITTDGKGHNNIITDAAGFWALYNEDGPLNMFKGLDSAWHRDSYNDSRTLELNGTHLPKHVVILDEEVGPFVIDISKSAVGANFKTNRNVASGKHAAYKLGTTWIYTPELAEGFVLSNWLNAGDANLTNACFAQSGAAGGVYDIVYYDGQLTAKLSVAGTSASEYGHIWGYADNGARNSQGGFEGFTSYMANVTENYGTVYSYNKKLDAGFYSLIKVDGKLFVARELDGLTSKFIDISYDNANRSKYGFDAEAGIIKGKKDWTEAGKAYMLYIRGEQNPAGVYGIDAGGFSSRLDCVVIGSSVAAIAPVTTTTVDFAKKAVTDVTYLTAAAAGDITLVSVDILAQKTTVTTTTDTLAYLNGSDNAVTTTVDVKPGDVVGTVYGVKADGDVDKNTVLGKVVVVKVDELDDGWRTFTFAVTVGDPVDLAPITETKYDGLAKDPAFGNSNTLGYVVSAADKNNIDAILSAPSQTPGSTGGTTNSQIIVGCTHQAANIDANGAIKGIATFTYAESADELYFNIAFAEDAQTAGTIATTDMIEIFDEPKPVV